MSKRQLLIILGVFVMAFLFLGFPPAWDKICALIAGLWIVISAYRGVPSEEKQKADVPFVEHRSAPAEPVINQTPETNS